MTLMGINWKVRISNPIWWAQVVCSIFLPIQAYFGLNWEDMTSWKAIQDLVLQSIQNPVVVISVIVSLYNTLIDPTTKGIADSVQAMTYDKPKAS